MSQQLATVTTDPLVDMDIFYNGILSPEPRRVVPMGVVILFKRAIPNYKNRLLEKYDLNAVYMQMTLLESLIPDMIRAVLPDESEETDAAINLLKAMRKTR